MENKINEQSNITKERTTENEISLNKIIIEFNFWKKILIRNIYKIFLISLLFGILGFVYAFIDKPKYVASTRFMLKNEGVGSLFGGQMTGLTSLLGGGQMGTPLERTAEVIKSDRIVGRVLLRSVKIRDTTDLVINHFIRLTKLKQKLQNEYLAEKDDFNIDKLSIDSLSIPQRKIFKRIREIMAPEIGAGVINKTFDKKSGVLSITCTHIDEDFAIELSNVIYQELNNFFIEQMTYTSSKNADVVKNKVDSIESELNRTRRSLATMTDQSLGLLLQQDKVELKKLSIKEQMLNVMYAEALKNYESFQFMNQAAMPSLTLIDYPYSPIKPKQRNKLLYATALFIVGFIFSFMVFRVNEIIK